MKAGCAHVVLLSAAVLAIASTCVWAKITVNTNPLLRNGDVHAKKPSPSSINFKCVAEHCAAQFAGTLLDKKFYEMTSCELGCNPFYYNDTTPGKLHYQNCTTKCALTFESAAGNKFMGCAMENNCMEFAKINGTCPAPEVDPESSLASLSGEW